MANSASRGYTFGATELVTNAKLHALVDSATITVDTANIASTTSNTLKIGDGSAGNKILSVDNGDANLPNLRFNDTGNAWEYSNDGTTWSAMGSGGGGSTTVRGSFTYGSLVSGVCSVSHLMSLPFPYTLDVSMSQAKTTGVSAMFPDDYRYGQNAFTIDLTSFTAASNASIIFGYSY